ncbi:MAG TPA: NTP transferase domain-containing protein [Spirochaetota bacterium]|nr:NTP transferase domain-containing protein [Spirochaetota bacterium]
MRAVVLAAGTGSRLGEITKARTKGMVPVRGKKLIDYLLEFFEHDFFDEIIVVGGFCYEDLREHINSHGYKNVRVVENKEYLKGNIFTLITALREFSGDSFLITNVDHIYPGVMFNKMKESMKAVTAMCDFDRTLGDDDMKVKLGGDGKRVSAISKKLNDFDCGYIGMTYVDASMESLYRDTINEVLESYGEKAVVENILQVLSEKDQGVPVICDLSGFGWYEVDTEEDLMRAEKGLENDLNFK